MTWRNSYLEVCKERWDEFVNLKVRDILAQACSATGAKLNRKSQHPSQSAVTIGRMRLGSITFQCL